MLVLGAQDEIKRHMEEAPPGQQPQHRGGPGRLASLRGAQTTRLIPTLFEQHGGARCVHGEAGIQRQSSVLTRSQILPRRRTFTRPQKKNE